MFGRLSNHREQWFLSDRISREIHQTPWFDFALQLHGEIGRKYNASAPVGPVSTKSARVSFCQPRWSRCSCIFDTLTTFARRHLFYLGADHYVVGDWSISKKNSCTAKTEENKIREAKGKKSTKRFLLFRSCVWLAQSILHLKTSCTTQRWQKKVPAPQNCPTPSPTPSQINNGPTVP